MYSRLHKRTKLLIAGESGHAMLWALVILFVVMISGTVVMRADLAFYKQIQRRALKKRAHWLAESGVERFLAELNDSSREPSALIEIPISDTINENETITRTLYPWAGTLLAVSIGRVGTISDTSSEIIGQKSDLPDSVIVRTRNPQYPLVLSGSTNSEGKVMSMAGSPTAGLFRGRGPTQSRVDGWTYHEDDTPSELNPWLMKHELTHLKQLSREIAPHILGSLRLSGVNLENEFSDDTTVIAGDLELINCTLSVKHSPRLILVTGDLLLGEKTIIKGRVKLWSLRSVLIAGECIVESSAIVCDSVVGLEETALVGSHLLAGYGVTVDDMASLAGGATVSTYMSGETGRATPIYSILVTSSAKLSGALSSFCDSTMLAVDIPRIMIDTGVNYSGAVTSNHFVENYSDVVASFDVDGFWFKKSPTTYVNWVADRWLREESGRRGANSVLISKGLFVSGD